MSASPSGVPGVVNERLPDALRAEADDAAISAIDDRARRGRVLQVGVGFGRDLAPSFKSVLAAVTAEWGGVAGSTNARSRILMASAFWRRLTSWRGVRRVGFFHCGSSVKNGAEWLVKRTYGVVARAWPLIG